jgi:hypothetical protein
MGYWRRWPARPAPTLLVLEEIIVYTMLFLLSQRDRTFTLYSFVEKALTNNRSPTCHPTHIEQLEQDR